MPVLPHPKTSVTGAVMSRRADAAVEALSTYLLTCSTHSARFIPVYRIFLQSCSLFFLLPRQAPSSIRLALSNFRMSEANGVFQQACRQGNRWMMTLNMTKTASATATALISSTTAPISSIHDQPILSQLSLNSSNASRIRQPTFSLLTTTMMACSMSALACQRHPT